MPLENILPPFNMESAQYGAFDFTTTSLELIEMVPLAKVCRGVLCDSQSGVNACGCLTTVHKRESWAGQFTLSCGELASMERTTSVLVSIRLTQQFVHHNLFRLPVIDPLEMEDSVSLARTSNKTIYNNFYKCFIFINLFANKLNLV